MGSAVVFSLLELAGVLHSVQAIVAISGFTRDKSTKEQHAYNQIAGVLHWTEFPQLPPRLQLDLD